MCLSQARCTLRPSRASCSCTRSSTRAAGTWRGVREWTSGATVPGSVGAVGIRYVQGMNEMLAPIYYAFSAELEAAPAVQALLEPVTAISDSHW